MVKIERCFRCGHGFDQDQVRGLGGVYRSGKDRYELCIPCINTIVFNWIDDECERRKREEHDAEVNG